MKTILFDFDGVIHSYTSGWQGMDFISDKPVEGILEVLTNLVYDKDYEVMIYSSRSQYKKGIKAMKGWLDCWLNVEIEKINNTPENKWKDMWQWKILNDHQSIEPWHVHEDRAINKFINKIKFPKKKPPAYITIDDRAICFDGDSKDLINKINNFKVWYKD